MLFMSNVIFFAQAQALSALTNLLCCQTSSSISVVESGDTGMKAKSSQDGGGSERRRPLPVNIQVVSGDIGNIVELKVEEPEHHLDCTVGYL